MTGKVVFTPNPAAILGMVAPAGMVDNYTHGLAMAISATAKGLAPRDTGELAASIDVRRIGPSSWTVIADVPYAMAVHEGTKPHEITPKNGRILRFPSKGGTIVYTQKVNHPGTQANPFLEKAMKSVVRS